MRAFWASFYKDAHLISEALSLLHGCLLKYINLGTPGEHRQSQCTEGQLAQGGRPPQNAL